MATADAAPHGLARLAGAIASADRLPSELEVSGAVTEIGEDGLRVAGLSDYVRLGDLVRIETDGDGEDARVVRIDERLVLVRSFAGRTAARLGASVRRTGPALLRPGPGWLGRVVDGQGRPIDGQGPLPLAPVERDTAGAAPPALDRQPVGRAIRTGVRAVDLFTPLCYGQRIGIFAGSGVGKSTLLAMLARSPGFDAVVLALCGERGREVRGFLEDTLGDARTRTCAVVATGDESAMMRSLAPGTAMCVAEALRDEGLSVLLIVDSVTRYAHALRDVATAAGEMPVMRGYPPGVFSALPRLLERAGPGTGDGSITGVFAVLLDGDDPDEPVADTIRGTLDGHIVLDRTIADRGRFPAVDVLASLSRMADRVWSADERRLIAEARAMMARYEDTRDLRAMGAHRPGADPELDRAVLLVPAIEDVLAQDVAAPPEGDAFDVLATRLRALLQPQEAGSGAKA